MAQGRCAALAHSARNTNSRPFRASRCASRDRPCCRAPRRGRPRGRAAPPATGTPRASCRGSRRSSRYSRRRRARTSRRRGRRPRPGSGSAPARLCPRSGTGRERGKQVARGASGQKSVLSAGRRGGDSRALHARACARSALRQVARLGPHLHGDYPVVDLDLLGQKVCADRGFVRVGELLVDVPACSSGRQWDVQPRRRERAATAEPGPARLSSGGLSRLTSARLSRGARRSCHG